MVKITIRIPDELKYRIKEFSSRNYMTQNEMMIKLLECGYLYLINESLKEEKLRGNKNEKKNIYERTNLWIRTK